MAISLRIIDEALSRAVLQTTPASLDLNFHSFIEYLLTFILFIGAGSLLPITALIVKKMEDNAFSKGVRRHLKSRAESAGGEAAQALPGEVTAHPTQMNTQFIRVGRFNAKYGTQLRPKFGPHGETELKITTFFEVDTPPTQAFHLSIGLRADHWNGREAIEASELANRLSWNVPEAELMEALRKSENLRLLHELFQLGPGQITCDNKEFSIQLECSLTREAHFEQFYRAAKSLFYVYARVAQMNLPEWRAPENNYDWWAEDEEAGGEEALKR